MRLSRNRPASQPADLFQKIPIVAREAKSRLPNSTFAVLLLVQSTAIIETPSQIAPVDRLLSQSVTRVLTPVSPIYLMSSPPTNTRAVKTLSRDNKPG